MRTTGRLLLLLGGVVLAVAGSARATELTVHYEEGDKNFYCADESDVEGKEHCTEHCVDTCVLNRARGDNNRGQFCCRCHQLNVRIHRQPSHCLFLAVVLPSAGPGTTWC